MSTAPVQTDRFKVDTSRPRSRMKMRSKIRHVLAVASGMFPFMALFVYGMSLFQHSAQRAPYHKLIVAFIAAGMVSLMLYAWARAEKQRRREVSARNRERKYREREEELRREREKISARKAAAAAAGKPAPAPAKEG
ncbi:MAG: hypothetical protein AB7V22_00405 [Kiritimatiellia bacterium]